MYWICCVKIQKIDRLLLTVKILNIFSCTRHVDSFVCVDSIPQMKLMFNCFSFRCCEVCNQIELLDFVTYTLITCTLFSNTQNNHSYSHILVSVNVSDSSNYGNHELIKDFCDMHEYTFQIIYCQHNKYRMIRNWNDIYHRLCAFIFIPNKYLYSIFNAYKTFLMHDFHSYFIHVFYGY